MARYFKTSPTKFLDNFIFQPNYNVLNSLAQQEALNNSLKKRTVKGFDYIETFPSWQEEANNIINEINYKKIRPLAEKLMNNPSDVNLLTDLRKTVDEVHNELMTGTLGDMVLKYKSYNNEKKSCNELLKKAKDENERARIKARCSRYENYAMNTTANGYNPDTNISRFIPEYNINKEFTDNIDTESLKYTVKEFRKNSPYIVVNNKPLFQKDWGDNYTLINNGSENYVIDKTGKKYQVGQNYKDFQSLGPKLPFQYVRYDDEVEGYYKNNIIQRAMNLLSNNPAYIDQLRQDYFDFGYGLNNEEKPTQDGFKDYIKERIKQEALSFADQYPIETSRKEFATYKTNEYGMKAARQKHNSSASVQLKNDYFTKMQESKYNNETIKAISSTYIDLLFKRYSGNDFTPQQQKEFDKYNSEFGNYIDDIIKNNSELFRKAIVYSQNKDADYSPYNPIEVIKERNRSGKEDSQLKKYKLKKENEKAYKEFISIFNEAVSKDYNEDKKKEFIAMTYPIPEGYDGNGNAKYTSKDDKNLSNDLNRRFLNGINNGYEIYNGNYSHRSPIGTYSASSPVEGGQYVAGNKTGDLLRELMNNSGVNTLEGLFETGTIRYIEDAGDYYISGTLKNDIIEKSNKSNLFNGLRDSDNNKVSNKITIRFQDTGQQSLYKKYGGSDQQLSQAVFGPRTFANDIYNATLESVNDGMKLKDNIITTPVFNYYDNNEYYFKYDKTDKTYEMFKKGSSSPVKINGKGPKIDASVIKYIIEYLYTNDNAKIE